MDRLRGSHRSGWLVFVVVVALAGVIGGGVGGSLLSNRHKTTNAQDVAKEAKAAADQAKAAALKADKAVKALCAQRKDIDLRIAVTQALVHDRPHARFIFAIPRRYIVQGLARDINTRSNLDILDCRRSK